MTERVLDSRQLLAFEALASTGSFTEAGKRLRLTQSAVSHSIRALEEDVGQSLIDRRSRRLRLTRAGEALLASARRTLGQMRAARAELEALGKWGGGRLRVGAGTTACQYLLPTVIREFKQTFPDCQLSIAPGDARELLEGLRQNEIDLALTLIPPGHLDIDSQVVFEDTLQFFVAPSHPWAKRERAPAGEIESQTYIVYSKRAYTFELVQRRFRLEGRELDRVIELGSMEAIKEMAKIGIGVGILAPWIAQKELREGSLRLVGMGSRPPRRRWGVCRLKGRRLTLPEETFAGLCEAVGADL